MAVHTIHYEELLAEYSNYDGAIALLKQHRPYLETIPSMRRPDESIITIPLPNVRVRQTISKPHSDIKVAAGEVIPLPCDVVVLMCDPEWKIKTGVEIPIYIHRPQEDFSALLTRWRHTQVLLSQEYEWLMPMRYQHLLSEGADKVLPIFVVFPETPERILRGLRGAGLPFVTQSPAVQEDFVDADDESAEFRESQDQPQD